MRVAVVIGTRPEAIKLAPVAEVLRADPAFETEVWLSGQHREMLDQVVDTFGLAPDVDLDLMAPGQALTDLMAAALVGFGDTIRSRRPDVIVVQGDTTTAAAAAIAGFTEHVAVGHVEAGLRSGDLDAPFPEEANRRLITVTTRWHFAPTDTAAAALRREGVAEGAIHVTGNTVVDALHRIVDLGPPAGFDERFAGHARLVVVTMHRRENHGDPIDAVCEAIVGLAADHIDVGFVVPVHPNPAVAGAMRAGLGTIDSITLTEPLDYRTMVHLMRRATLVITDSGGLQEEAPALGVPVLVTRDTTERPEGVAAGTARLVGTDAGTIRTAAHELLTDAAAHAAMANAVSPYGDGHAATRIVEVLRHAEL